MLIDKFMVNTGESIYYDEAFRATLESHMGFLRSSDKTRTVSVVPQKADVYNGDLFGYLGEVGIPYQYHWIIMRVNAFTSPYDFGSETYTLLVPDQKEIETIRVAHISSTLVTL